MASRNVFLPELSYDHAIRKCKTTINCNYIYNKEKQGVMYKP